MPNSLTDQVLFRLHATDFLSENVQNCSPAKLRSSVTLQHASVFLIGKKKDGLITITFFFRQSCFSHPGEMHSSSMNITINQHLSNNQ